LDHPFSHSSRNFQETLLAARSISLKLYVNKVHFWEFPLGADLSATHHMMRPMRLLPILPLKPGPFFRHPKLVSSFSAWKSTTHKTYSKPSGSTHPETDLHDARVCKAQRFGMLWCRSDSVVKLPPMTILPYIAGQGLHPAYLKTLCPPNHKHSKHAPSGLGDAGQCAQVHSWEIISNSAQGESLGSLRLSTN
jgi:hypothetical protein